MTRQSPRVLVDHFEGAPVAAVYLWIDAGSVEEGPDQHGAAHFVEHMLFKGTERRSLEELAGFVEGMGGEINAYTSYERTVLHATVPAEHWEQTLEILVDMALNPRFDPTELEREREVILEEIRGGQDDPMGTLAEEVARTLFHVHPYGRPVIGSSESVRGMTREALMAFHREHYRADQLVVGVSGPMAPEAVVKKVEELVPSAPKRVHPPRPTEPRQQGLRVLQISGRFEEPLLELSFRGVSVEDTESAALDCLMLLLAGSPASILGERLQLTGLATETWAWSETERDPGMLTVGCAPLEGQELACLQALGQALAELPELLGLAGLHRAQAQILSEKVFLQETVDGRAHDMVWYAALRGDPGAAELYRAQVQAVDLDSLRKAARYLDLDQAVLGVLSPKELPEPKLRAALQVPAPPARKARPAIEQFTLSNGLRVVLEPRPVPLVAARLAVLGGQLAETPGTAGISQLWASCVGAPGLGPRELAERLDLAGGVLAGFGGRQSMGLRWELPGERMDLGLEIASGMLTRPHFPADEVKRGRAELRHDWFVSQDDPGTLAERALREQLLGPHPNAMPRGGKPASLARMGVSSLKRLHRQRIAPEGMVLALSGAVDPERTLERVEALFGRMSGAGAPMESVKPLAQAGERRIPIKREQAHVLLGWPGLCHGDPKGPALALAVTCLNGQGGRLFMELREKRGWAYSVSASTEQGLELGVFTAHIAVAPELADKARVGLEEVLRSFAQDGPTAEELEKARRGMLGGRAMGRQRSASRALDLCLGALYGKDPATVWEQDEAAIRACTVAQVRDTIGEILEGPQAVVFAGGLR